MFVVFLFHRIFAASRGIEQSFDGRRQEPFYVALSSTNGIFEILYKYINIYPVSKDRLRVPAMEVEIHIL